MKAFITTSKNSPKSGFSLFELLIVVAIFGIMASIVLPLFGNTEDMRQTRAKRNAHTLCTMASSASSAGLNVADGTTSVEEAFKKLVQGVVISKGSLKGYTFKLPGLDDEKIKEASAYAKIMNNELIYQAIDLEKKTL